MLSSRRIREAARSWRRERCFVRILSLSRPLAPTEISKINARRHPRPCTRNKEVNNVRRGERTNTSVKKKKENVCHLSRMSHTLVAPLLQIDSIRVTVRPRCTGRTP